MKSLLELTEREVLALAISSEEEDSRIYLAFAGDLAERYPASASVFEKMAEEEEGHRHRLLDQYQQRFGSKLPPIRREDVKGFLWRRPIWLTRNLPLETIRKEAENMEFQAARFYDKAAERTTDVGVRTLFGDLAAAERGTKAAPRSSRQNSSRPRQEQRRRRLSGGCLSYDMCNLASPA
jgi:rubrerythrin